MNDYYLKFESRDAGEALLVNAELLIQCLDEENAINLIPAAAVNYDPIGTIYKETGKVDADGLPTTAPIDGWHCNLRLAGALPTALDPFAVVPATPARVWA